MHTKKINCVELQICLCVNQQSIMVSTCAASPPPSPSTLPTTTTRASKSSAPCPYNVHSRYMCDVYALFFISILFTVIS